MKNVLVLSILVCFLLLACAGNSPTSSYTADDFDQLVPCTGAEGDVFASRQCQQFYARLSSAPPTTGAAVDNELAASQAGLVRPVSQGKTEVPLRRLGVALIAPVTINNAIQLPFVIDSGASDVSIPANVVSALMQAGTISSADFLGKRTYTLANGSSVISPMFRIKSLKVGDQVLENVLGSEAPPSGVLLLGQSFLSRFRSWTIDNRRMVLVLE
jgi:hypothetical protein